MATVGQAYTFVNLLLESNFAGGYWPPTQPLTTTPNMWRKIIRKLQVMQIDNCYFVQFSTQETINSHWRLFRPCFPIVVHKRALPRTSIHVTCMQVYFNHSDRE